MTAPDRRTVHARRQQTEIVRYDRAGKWYVEAGGSRRPVGVREAAMIARQWRNEAGGTWHPNLPGGKMFDSLVRTPGQ